MMSEECCGLCIGFRVPLFAPIALKVSYGKSEPQENPVRKAQE